MSKKQQIESSNTPELTPIEEKLLDCAKNGIPVLLYGKDTIGRKELVLKVHKLNDGIDSDVEYFNDSGEFVPEEEYVRSIANFMISTGKNKLKTYHSRSTQRTWDYINCAGMTAKEVYHELAESTRIKRKFDDYEATAFERKLQSIGISKDNNYVPGILFGCNGMLFLDNLACNDKNDSIYYDKIARVLENKGVDCKVATFEWLVVCASNPESLPRYFKEQFKEVNLEPESIPEKQEQSNGQGIPESIPQTQSKLVFFDNNYGYLWFNKDNPVRLEPEDARVLGCMVDIIVSNNRELCRKEELILKAYRSHININKIIPEEIDTKLNSWKSTVNRIIRDGLGIPELIIKGGLKCLKFSIKINICKF